MVRVSWLVEKRVILINIGVELTEDEAIQMNADVVNLLNQGEGDLVHVVFLADKVQKFPSSVSWLRDAMNFVNHPKRGHHITVTRHRVLRFIGAVIYRTHARGLPRMVGTYAECKQMLEELDNTLPPLPDTIED